MEHCLEAGDISTSWTHSQEPAHLLGHFIAKIFQMCCWLCLLKVVAIFPCVRSEQSVIRVIPMMSLARPLGVSDMNNALPPAFKQLRLCLGRIVFIHLAGSQGLGGGVGDS